jgi:hypothetical protein
MSTGTTGKAKEGRLDLDKKDVQRFDRNSLHITVY